MLRSKKTTWLLIGLLSFSSICSAADGVVKVLHEYTAQPNESLRANLYKTIYRPFQNPMTQEIDQNGEDMTNVGATLAEIYKADLVRVSFPDVNPVVKVVAGTDYKYKIKKKVGANGTPTEITRNVKIADPLP